MTSALEPCTGCAVGYNYEAVKIFMPANREKPVYAKYIEHIPPDVTAGIFWLKNRDPQMALRDWCVKRGVNLREFIAELSEAGVCLNQWKYVTLGAGTDYTSARVRCLEIDGNHEKVSGLFGDESADVLPFRRRVDPNNDDSLGGVSDDAEF
jgi:hypothetical protein